MRPAFQLAHMCVNHLVAVQLRGDTPHGRGGPAPQEAGPKMGLQAPWSLFDTTAQSWKGPPRPPIPPVFSLRTPRFPDLQNLPKPTVNHLSRSSYADTPPYGTGVNNHLSRSSYGEDPHHGTGGDP